MPHHHSKKKKGPTYERFALTKPQWALMIQKSWLADMIVETGLFNDEDETLQKWRNVMKKWKAENHPAARAMEALSNEMEEIVDTLSQCIVRAMLSEHSWPRVQRKAWQTTLRWQLCKQILSDAEARLNKHKLLNTKKWPDELSFDKVVATPDSKEVLSQPVPEHGLMKSTLKNKVKTVDKDSILDQLRELQELEATDTAAVRGLEQADDDEREINQSFIQRATRFPPADLSRFPESARRTFSRIWIKQGLPTMAVNKFSGWLVTEVRITTTDKAEARRAWIDAVERALSAWEQEYRQYLPTDRVVFTSTEAKHGRDEDDEDDMPLPHPRLRADEEVPTFSDQEFSDYRRVRAYRDSLGRFHNPDGPARVVYDPVSGVDTKEQYWIHGQIQRSDPAFPVTISRRTDGSLEGKEWSHPGLPDIRFRVGYDGEEEWKAPGQWKLTGWPHGTLDQPEIKRRMDVWNDAAQKTGSERLSLLDRWSIDGQNKLPKDLSQHIHRQYLNVVPFPERYAEMKESSTQAKHGRDEGEDEKAEAGYMRREERFHPDLHTQYSMKYVDREGRLHNPFGVAEYSRGYNGSTSESYAVHGVARRAEPGPTAISAANDGSEAFIIWEHPDLPTIQRWFGGEYRVGDGDEDPEKVNAAMDQWNAWAIRKARAAELQLKNSRNASTNEYLPSDLARKIANEYVAPLPFPQRQSGTQGRHTGSDVDDDVQLTINALELLPPNVHKIHGCFARMVYSYQKRKAPPSSHSKKQKKKKEEEEEEEETSSEQEQTDDEEEEEVIKVKKQKQVTVEDVSDDDSEPDDSGSSSGSDSD